VRFSWLGLHPSISVKISAVEDARPRRPTLALPGQTAAWPLPTFLSSVYTAAAEASALQVMLLPLRPPVGNDLTLRFAGELLVVLQGYEMHCCLYGTNSHICAKLVKVIGNITIR